MSSVISNWQKLPPELRQVVVSLLRTARSQEYQRLVMEGLHAQAAEAAAGETPQVGPMGEYMEGVQDWMTGLMGRGGMIGGAVVHAYDLALLLLEKPEDATVRCSLCNEPEGKEIELPRVAADVNSNFSPATTQLSIAVIDDRNGHPVYVCGLCVQDLNEELQTAEPILHGEEGGDQEVELPDDYEPPPPESLEPRGERAPTTETPAPARQCTHARSVDDSAVYCQLDHGHTGDHRYGALGQIARKAIG